MSELSIETRGRGARALVLIHGWAMHGGIFAPLMAELAADFTLYAVDLPGHGYSRESTLALDTDTVRGALRGRVPAGALWLGWSMGGLFALAAARDDTLAPRALALLSVTPRFVQAPDWPQAMPRQQFAAFAQALAVDYRATVNRFLALEVLGDAGAQTDLRALRRDVFARGEPDPARLREGLELLQHSDLRDTLRGIAQPALWLAGRRDRLVPPAAQRRAAQAMPQGQYAELEHAAHAGFIGHAHEVAAALRRLAERAA